MFLAHGIQKRVLGRVKSFIYAPLQHFEYNSILDPYI